MGDLPTVLDRVLGSATCTFAWHSTLWLAMGLVASRLLRRRAAWGHLVLMLAAAAAILSPASKLTVRQMDWGLFPAGQSMAQLPTARPPGESSRLVGPSESAATPSADLVSGRMPRGHNSNMSGAPTLTANDTTDWPERSASSARYPQQLPTIIAVCWLVASCVLAARLACSLRAGRHITRAARAETSPALLAALCQSARALGLRSVPDLRVSPQAQCPLVWCWGRPHLLLPESASGTQGVNWQSIFCHELAHLVRRDHWSALWGEALVIALPWQPLAWRSRRRLSFLREQACDDWVLAAGSEATEYADSLLSFLPQQAPALGLSVLGGQESLKHRLERLLAAVRVNPRVGTTHIAATACIALTAVVGIALAQPGSAVDKSTAHSPADDPAARPKDRSAETPNTRFSGRVVQPDGKPASAARIFLTRWLDREIPLKATTGSDGKFDFSVNSDVLFGTRWLQVVAVKPGFGLAWIKVDDLNRTANLTLKLVADDRPIDGRIFNLEGRPVVGATVRVASVSTFANDDPQPYVELLKSDAIVRSGQSGREMKMRAANFRFQSELSEIPQAPSARTDEQGHFRLTGIGRHRCANLTIAGRSIADTRLQVLTDPFEAPLNIWQTKESSLPAHGAQFTHYVRPSRPVVGIVTNAQSGRPIEGVRVSQLNGGSPATTDASGRFKLDGCAKADEYKLFALPPDQTLYFSGSLTARDQPGLSPLEVQLHVYPAIPLAGRVIDTISGRPVPAEVQYFPLYPNASVMQGKYGSAVNSLGPSSQSFSKPDGSFAIGVAPGPGALFVRAVGKDKYEPARVDAEAFFKQRAVPYHPDSSADGARDYLTVAIGKTLRISIPQHQFQGIALLNVPETAKEVAQDVSVRSTPTSTGR
jgi:beta-lactamase regulating signal transducer with metallopeptidase domain